MTTINERAPGLLDQPPGPTGFQRASEREAAWERAHQMERASRVEGHRRTAEAQADIASARAAPTADQQEAEADAWLQERREAWAKEQRTAPAEAIGLDVALSDAALQATPAVREMGGFERAMRKADQAADEAVRELRDAPTAYRAGDPCPDCGVTLVGMGHVCGPAEAQELYGKLRRELAHALGVDRDTDWQTLLARASLPTKAPAACAHDPRRPTDALVDQRSRCLGTYGSFHGVPTKCSPVAGCGLRGCEWQRPAKASITCDRCGNPCEPGLESWAARHAACSPSLSPPPDAIVLTGPEAERYRALQTAALAAQEATRTAKAAGAKLLELFQAFCAGVTPAPEKP